MMSFTTGASASDNPALRSAARCRASRAALSTASRAARVNWWIIGPSRASCAPPGGRPPARRRCPARTSPWPARCAPARSRAVPAACAARRPPGARRVGPGPRPRRRAASLLSCCQRRLTFRRRQPELTVMLMIMTPRIEVAERPGVGLDGAVRPSEDVVVVLPQAVVLLDGATSFDPALPTGGWYASRLAGELAGRLAGYPDTDLADLLAAAIKTVARDHELVPGRSPSSTVALLRWTDTVIEGLVLADSPIVAFTADGPSVLADTRIATMPRGSGYR